MREWIRCNWKRALGYSACAVVAIIGMTWLVKAQTKYMHEIEEELHKAGVL